MTDALITFCTCSSRDEALKLAHAIVSEEAAACVNIMPAVESVYRWEGKIENAQEVLLLIKTTRARFADLARADCETAQLRHARDHSRAGGGWFGEISDVVGRHNNYLKCRKV